MGFAGTHEGAVAAPDTSLYLWLVLAAAIALFAPNTQQLARYSADPGKPLRLPPVPLLTALRGPDAALSLSPATAVLCGILFAAALACIWRPAIFIYFNF
jgi:hypothetical protein